MDEHKTQQDDDLLGKATSLSGRYAKALFELAHEHAKVDEIHKCLQKFSNLLSQSTELKSALENPSMSSQQHIAVITAISEKLEFSRILQKFLITLAQNRRLSKLSEITSLYTQFVHHFHQIKTIEVASAYALTSSQKQNLTTILGKNISGQLTINFCLDPSLLGGILIREGSRIIDATLKSQLAQLATVMKGSI